MTAFWLSLTACNKGKALIEQATKENAEGNLREAVRLAEQVGVDAPGTPEVEQAKALAAGWLVEAYDAQAKSGSGAPPVEHLLEALRLEPSNGGARIRECALAVSASKFDRARVCLNDELPRTTGAPEERVKQVRAALAAHDAAQERTRWLASNDPKDWLRLVAKYPRSADAQAALGTLVKPGKIVAQSTFCYSPRIREVEIVRYLLGVTDDVADQANKLAETVTRAISDDAAQMLFALGIAVIGERQLEFAEQIETIRRELEAHAFQPEEEAARKEVLAHWAEVREIALMWGKLSRFRTGTGENATEAWTSTRSRVDKRSQALHRRITEHGGKCFAELWQAEVQEGERRLVVQPAIVRRLITEQLGAVAPAEATELAPPTGSAKPAP